MTRDELALIENYRACDESAKQVIKNQLASPVTDKPSGLAVLAPDLVDAAALRYERLELLIGQLVQETENESSVVEGLAYFLSAEITQAREELGLLLRSEKDD